MKVVLGNTRKSKKCRNTIVQSRFSGLIDRKIKKYHIGFLCLKANMAANTLCRNIDNVSQFNS